MPGRREESSAESRRRIIKATLDLCGEVGPRAFTVNDVAERSGISRGSIPHHFGSKDGLIKAMVQEVFAHAEAQLRQYLAGIEAPTVADVVAAHYTARRSRAGRVFAGIHQEVLFPDTVVLDDYVEGWRRLRAVFAEHLTPLVDARPELGPVDQLAGTIQAALVGINLQTHLDGGLDRASAYDAVSRVLEIAEATPGGRPPKPMSANTS